MPARLSILAVPNDDGFGPSALLSYVVKAILREEPRARVTLWNDFAFEFNRTLYAREVAAGRVAVERVWNMIQLARPDGDVSVEATLRRMGDYRRAASLYARGTDPRAFDLVLDFGVPAAARWAAGHGLASVSVFDHAWSATLRMIGGGKAPRAWSGLAAAIEEDERQVQRLILFPPFLTPPPFSEHWRRLLAAERITVLPRVLRDPSAWSRERARKFLGVSTAGCTLLIQGGGTAVWDRPLRRLVEQLERAPGRSPLSRRRLDLVLWSPAVARMDVSRLARVHRLPLVPGATVQALLPAIDFAVLRAGGGSVNDAVAHRVPFVCVREPAQLQIEAILGECVARGLTRALEPELFLSDPFRAIVSECKWMRERRPRLAERLSSIPIDGARDAARRILSLVR